MRVATSPKLSPKRKGNRKRNNELGELVLLPLGISFVFLYVLPQVIEYV